MEELAGKVAVVTGAASGIGLAIAERFAGEGMRVVMADVEEAALEAAAKMLGDAGAEVLAVPTDVSRGESVEACARAAVDRFGTFHVACNNAGVGGKGFSSWEMPLSGWEWVIDVNLWGVIHGVRAFLPTLVAQNEGHLVNTASLAGIMGVPFLAPYAAAKNAVVGISESIHYELTLTGSAVGVTVVCPSFVATRISDSDRNWPEKLGPIPEPDQGPLTQMIEEVFRAKIAEGTPPAALAAEIVEAVRTKRFFVTTDPAGAEHILRGRLAWAEGRAPELPALE